jgi:hypothetical protein
METVLSRTGTPPAAPPRPIELPSHIRASFAMLAQRLVERVTLPHRDLPPEWFRFPLP